MIKRSIYYWAGAYRNPLQKKMSYNQLRPVIAINILNFSLFEQTEQFHTQSIDWILRNDNTLFFHFTFNFTDSA